MTCWLPLVADQRQMQWWFLLTVYPACKVNDKVHNLLNLSQIFNPCQHKFEINSYFSSQVSFFPDSFLTTRVRNSDSSHYIDSTHSGRVTRLSLQTLANGFVQWELLPLRFPLSYLLTCSSLAATLEKMMVPFLSPICCAATRMLVSPACGNLSSHMTLPGTWRMNWKWIHKLIGNEFRMNL